MYFTCILCLNCVQNGGSNLVLNTNFAWYVMASVSYDYRHQEYLQEHQEFLDRLEVSRLRIQRTQRWHFL